MSHPPAAAESTPPDLFAAPADLLQDLLAVSLTAVNLLRPLYAPTGEVVDFAVEYLNPAAQRMTGLPERPGGTMRSRFPHTFANGVFALYRQVMETGQEGRYGVNYQTDGFDNYFHVAARRSGEWLLVSFTDTADQDRSAVELALRESQAAERAARAAAEAQRQRFYEVLLHLPAQVAIYHGPDHVFGFVNERFRSFVPAADLLGRPVREAAQGAVGEEVFAQLDRVYATGEPVHLPELEIVLSHRDGPLARPLFVNAFYLPLRDGEGRIHGVLDFSYDVTEQVLARRQQQRLTQELEARVQARTAEVRRQQGHLQQILGQVPAAIATLLGPEHRFAFFNDAYQTLTEGRTRAGQSVAELLPEVAAQGFIGLLDEVYATGRPHVGTETPLAIHDPVTGQDVPHYLDFLYQPLLDEQGRPAGILAFAVDVTEKVQARQQAEALQAQVLAAARQQAHEREAFHNVFEQTPALVALLRAPGHRFEYVNPAYQALFPGQQLVGLDLAVAVPAAQEQGFVALLDRVYQTGETFFGADLPFTAAATDERPAQTTYFNFTYQAYREAGDIAGVSIFAFDVTEQVLARQEREAQQQQLADLFMQAPAPIAILDGPDLVFQLVNPAYQRAFPGRELLHKPLLEALPELVDSPVPDLLRHVYHTGEPVVMQELRLRLARHEGAAPEEMYSTFTYQARHDAQGTIDGVRVFAHDVTEQVLARQRTERSESRFRHLAETTPLVVWEANAQGQTTYLSPQWERFTAAANGQGLGWREYLHPDDQESFVQAWLTAVDSEQPFQAELRLRVATTGEYRWHLDRAVPVRDAAGTLVQWVGAAIDIHEQKLAEQQLQQLTAQLRAARDEAHALNTELTATNARLTRTNADLDTFVYTASHDLRSPITNIEGLLTALGEHLPEAARQAEPVPYLFNLLHGAVERFQLTLDQLTDIIKSQQTGQQPAEPIDLAALIADVRLDLAPLLAATHAQFDVNVAACASLYFAPQHLRSIVYNLLSNAVKYHHPDRLPVVQVRCCPAPGGHGPGSARQRVGPERGPAGAPLRPVPAPAHSRGGFRHWLVYHQTHSR
ncbi:PAS domain-containing protein [Hymenobacter sp. J193]|nr:PAS domain-containing protein [Hymenobacter sp. J193]MCR5890415.1 PAS domain-containing protein [Hymenobacter sp. J193]